MIYQRMKQLTLLSFLACSAVIFAGCSTVTPTETNPTDQTPVMSGTSTETTTTGEITTETTTESTTTKSIALAEVANHTTESDCRTAINGTVYDVTAFFGKHPGGDKNLFRVCGIDATQVFERKHGGDTRAKNVLAGFEIGTLAQ
jgi:cytochrome b involved in lipid metabolism